MFGLPPFGLCEAGSVSRWKRAALPGRPFHASVSVLALIDTPLSLALQSWGGRQCYKSHNFLVTCSLLCKPSLRKHLQVVHLNVAVSLIDGAASQVQGPAWSLGRSVFSSCTHNREQPLLWETKGSSRAQPVSPAARQC